MRFAFAAAAAALSLVIPVRATAQTSIDGFGALPMNQLSALGDTGVPFDFGGRGAELLHERLLDLVPAPGLVGVEAEVFV